MLRSWSFSALSVYKQCPYHSKLDKIDKVAVLPRPSASTGEHANDRGSRIHDACEKYVQDKGPLPIEAMHFKPELDRVKEYYAKGKVEAEKMWTFDKEWQITQGTPWLRVIIDGFVRLSPTEGLIYDLKTGKRRNNEIKHGEQVQLYQLATFLKYPELETLHCELWYLDADELAYTRYSRKQGLRFFNKFDKDEIGRASCRERV